MSKVFRPWVRKSCYWGKMLLSPIHCCDVTKPRYLLSGELCTPPLHSNRLYVYTICCRRGGQCFSVLRTRHTDVVGDSSGRSYVTEQGHNVPLLCTHGLDNGFHPTNLCYKSNIIVTNLSSFITYIWLWSWDQSHFIITDIENSQCAKKITVSLITNLHIQQSGSSTVSQRSNSINIGMVGLIFHSVALT